MSKKQATKAQRQRSLDEMETRLAIFGLTRDIIQIGEVLDLAKKFVETGESCQGSIAIPEAERVIQYSFLNIPDPREPFKSASRVVIKTV